MKTNVLFSFLLLIISFIHAQEVTNINIGVGLTSSGNELYVAELFGDKISKFNVVTGASSLQTVCTSSMSRPEGLALVGNELYVTRTQGSQIRKINIGGTLPASSTLVVSVNSPRALVYDATHGLYVSTAAASNQTNIYKIIGNSLSFVTTLPFNDVRSMAISGNTMYLTARNLGRIYKLDVTAANPTATIVKSGLSKPYDLVVSGNRLYFTTEAPGGLYRINDVTQPNPAVSTLVGGNVYGNLSGIEIIGTAIYYTSWGNNAIYKYTDATLSSPEFEQSVAFELDQNPVREVLKINTDQKVDALELFNCTGQRLVRTPEATTISVASLAQGMYFVKVFTSNGGVGIKRFIKE